MTLVILAFFFALCFGALPASAHAEQSPQSQDSRQGERTQPQQPIKRLDPNQVHYLVRDGSYEEAIALWEQASSKDRELFQTYIAWDLARAYAKRGDHEKAVAIYKPEYHFITESIEQRAELGEILLFGKIGTKGKDDEAIGRGQCALCHGFAKESKMANPQYFPSPPYGPHLFNFTQRVERIIASPDYRQRRRATLQKEAFPGSGMASNVIEYLAESNICPDCYVTPGFGVRDTNDRESPMPQIHKPPISLTIDEMIAIDTWLLKHEGYKIPPLAAMRAAYEKFLQPQDRPANIAGVRLAALYDLAGEIDEAIRILSANYIWRDDYSLKELRNDPESFKNLKRRPDLIEKFPMILRADK